MSNATRVEQLKWKKFECLDKGFVCLVDVMGSDESIVQAARVSYGEGTKKVSDDRTLIRYLMRNRHTTPFEMCELKLLVKVPMDTWRQWIRHRTASVNEYSTRYSVAIDEAQETMTNQWRLQSNNNKQGSSEAIQEWPEHWVADECETTGSPGNYLSQQETKLQDLSREVYEERIDMGIAREQARKDLPLCTYTIAYWKIDLHNLFHFLSLRMDSHAQKEIREYAIAIGEEIVKPLYPMAWEAFEDYRLNAMFLTRLDIEYIDRIINTLGTDYSEEEVISLQPEEWQGKKSCRERDEFLHKIKRLGIL